MDKKVVCNENKCKCCGGCISVCPVNAISLKNDKKLEIDQEKCVGCGKCVSFCPVFALSFDEDTVRSSNFETPFNYNERYDVIIVGAGPGGSYCAIELAKKGFSVLVIDKKQEIGTPVRCAEGFAIDSMKELGIEYDPQYCRKNINGAVIITPKGKKLVIEDSKDTGYVLERKIFEKKLSEKAMNLGAHYLINTYVYDLIIKNNFVEGVKVKGFFGEKEIFSSCVIAADGVDSKIARIYGIKTDIPLREIDTGFQYQLGGLNLEDPNKLYLFVGNNIAPRGYIWIFPKSETSANVGIGILGESDKTAKEYLDEFIKSHPEIFKNSYPIEINAGGIPVGKPLEKPYGNGLLIIGDAARIVNPLHGGGIDLAMKSGKLAAQVFEFAYNQNDFSEKTLKKYKELLEENIYNNLIVAWKLRRFFEKLSDDDLEYLAEKLTINDIIDFTLGKGIKKLFEILKERPSLLKLALSIL